MSQKPASSRQVPPPTRVSNGVPWWLWLVIGGFGVFVGITVVKKAIPDDPKLLAQEGFAALEKGDVAAVERSIEKLKQYPEHAAEVKLMEGMMYIGKSKPLLAVPLLREAADDQSLRTKAMVQLGSALTRSRQRLEAIEVFEAVLKEDDSADDARMNLAFLYKDMVSWETALEHLLVLKEHGHQLGGVHQMLADIYFDMGKFADAATEYKAAIEAEPTSPANSQKAARLMKCAIETGDFEGVDEFTALVDSEGIRDSVRALKLAQKGETEEALSALEHVLQEIPNDTTANVTHAQILAGLDSKERAIEGLTLLREPASYMTRSLKMFEAVAKLGINCGETRT
jgi:tetratricopeptide (TPR) repeat protein